MSGISLKHFLLYCVLGAGMLFLFHFEQTSIGPLRMAHIWKGAFLVFLLIRLISFRKLNLFYYKPLLMLCIFSFLGVELVDNPVNATVIFATTLLLPVFGVYIHRWSFESVSKLLIFLSCFIVLSFVPYYLGLLENSARFYDFSTSYGIDDVNGLVGPFQTTHNASTALAGSLLALTFYTFRGTYNRVALTIMVLLGFYFLTLTYARTGMAMYAVGLFVLVRFFLINSFRSFFLIVIAALAFVPFGYNVVLTNDALMARITGERARVNEFESFATMGSGRGSLYLASIKIFDDMSFVEKLSGIGETEQKRRMAEEVGRELVPHNGFLYILLTSGIIGFGLYSWFLVNIFRLLRTVRKSEYLILGKSMFLAYLAMTFFQNYNMMYMFMLMAITFSILEKSGRMNHPFKVETSVNRTSDEVEIGVIPSKGGSL